MNKQDFGARLRELRERRGLTQQTFADAAKLAVDTIRRLEHGRFSPSLDTMVKLGRGLGLTPPELLRDKFDQADDLAALIRELPVRDQHVAFAVVGALRVQAALDE